MHCADFENELTELIAGTPGVNEQRARLARLRAHARDCGACRGSGDLVEILAWGPGERDPVQDPGPDYWEGFESRLTERLRSAPTLARPRGRAWVAVAASLVLSAALALWTLFGRGPAPPAAERQAAQPHATPALEALARELDDAEPEALAAQLELLTGWSPAWTTGQEDADTGAPDPFSDAEGLFPDTESLDEDERRELLAWLSEQPS